MRPWRKYTGYPSSPPSPRRCMALLMRRRVYHSNLHSRTCFMIEDLGLHRLPYRECGCAIRYRTHPAGHSGGAVTRRVGVLYLCGVLYLLEVQYLHGSRKETTMAEWLTTSQVLQHTDLAITQQAVKKAAKRYYERCAAAGTTPEYVRKNSAGHWEVRSDWGLFQSWRQRGVDRAGQVRERHEREEELTRLRSLCAEQAQRITELEAALAEARGGKGTVPAEEPGEGAVPHEAADCGEEPNEGAVPGENTQVDDGERAKGAVPSDIFTDDAALLAYWIQQGKPSRRALGEMVGMSKSWVANHLRKAGAEQG